jgi:YVTN family beta-propeller protein
MNEVRKKRTRGLAVAMLTAGLIAVGLIASPGSSAGTAGEQAASDASESGDASGKRKKPKRTSVIAISNNWDGTIDFADAKTFEVLKRINVIPDYDERMAEIALDPVALGFFLGVRELIGEGHDQFVDDAFIGKGGRRIFISRPSFADVVAINLKTEEILWRTHVAGVRADHMALAPDGKQVIVSASTGNVGQVIRTKDGKIVKEFESGDSPHETNYSKDGERLFHAAIGRVYTPTDDAQLDTSKGKAFFEIVDADTMEILERINMKKKLAEAGHPGMSGAVRPMALSPNERYVYFQVSFFHGFVEYDFRKDAVTRIAHLPLRNGAAEIPKQDYLLDSAHHGIALNPSGKRFCVAGTMSNYAAIVNRKTFNYKIIDVGPKPYWSTNSANGKQCFVSVSGSDRVAVISYKKRKEIASIPVGDHPQRVRTGKIISSFLAD